MPEFQVANPTNKVKRTDHVWTYRSVVTGYHFKCVLCGAVCEQPPPFPTPKSWDPPKYEALSEEDRALCPFFRSPVLEVE